MGSGGGGSSAPSSSSSASSSSTSRRGNVQSARREHGKQVFEFEYFDDKLLEDLLEDEEKKNKKGLNCSETLYALGAVWKCSNKVNHSKKTNLQAAYFLLSACLISGFGMKHQPISSQVSQSHLFCIVSLSFLSYFHLIA
ncbi:hypothetical protein FH972_025766 [Carpinus fangiana]|uniref:Uncharacterized protein n=1 Tax=Carpinus fangiana TaxID=176857 RepID=A0A5N6L283_9ROSI|nr:hypothetical protein FH972_025766 [Carpinus fangiana]